MPTPVLPPVSLPWFDADGRPTIQYGLYAQAVASGHLPQLINAVNDAAAAAAGVSVGQMYRNGSILMVRVT